MNRALLSGWTKLVSGNALSGVLQLVAFAIAAQALDLAMLGIIVIIQTYARVADGLFNFQSVNVLTRFLAEAEANAEHARFRGLVKAGLLVDAGTALMACVIALVALPLVGPVFGLPEEWQGPAAVFCVVIATRIFGVCEAALRCFDRFGLIGLRSPGVAALTVVGSVGAWAAGAGADTFLYIWLVSELVGNLVFLVWALVVLRGHGVRGIRRASARDAIASCPRFWPMMWQTNATFAIRMLSQDGDVLLAGAVLGPAAAGLLRTAKNVSSVLGQMGRPLQQVASAPISRFAASGDYQAVFSTALRIGVWAGLAGLLAVGGMLLVGKFALALAFGPEYVAAFWITVILLLARCIYLSGTTLLPSMLALNLGGEFLIAVVLGTLAYIAVLIMAVPPMGLIGIGLANMAFELVWAITGWGRMYREVRHLAGKQASGAA